MAPPKRIAAKVADSEERPRTGTDIEELAAARAPRYQEIANLRIDTAALGREAAAVIVASVRDRFDL